MLNLFGHIVKNTQVKYDMEKRLSELKSNESGKIKNVFGNIHIRRRLYELGFLSGETIKIMSVSSLKNSYIVSLKGYCLALRKNILDNILVEEL